MTKRSSSSQQLVEMDSEGRAVRGLHDATGEESAPSFTKTVKSKQRNVALAISFICAVLGCLTVNSLGTFSLYGPQFLTHLGYSQIEVNAVSMAGVVSNYLSFPVAGALCDRTSPQVLALLCTIFSGSGYVLAAYVYDSGPPASGGWPVVVMMIAFLGIGFGTANIYIASLTALAKNFADSRFRGLTLSLPIAAIGVSQIWTSQVGALVLYQKFPDGNRSEVDVYQYLLFLSFIFIIVGGLGVFGLRLVPDMEENKSASVEAESLLQNEDDDNPTAVPARHKLVRRESLARARQLFLQDRAMWYLTAGLLLIAGPAESYISNLGTIIPSLDGGKQTDSAGAGRASLHISLLAFTSTIARLVGGSIVDLFTSPTQKLNEVGFAHVAILLLAALLTLGGFVNLAIVSPFLPSFLYVSSTFLGVGYGTTFSLLPIMVSIAWGPTSFGTNWGLIAMTPALSVIVFSVLYSIAYSSHIGSDTRTNECAGYGCFGSWAWVCAVSIGLAICSWIKTWMIWSRRNRK